MNFRVFLSRSNKEFFIIGVSIQMLIMLPHDAHALKHFTNYSNKNSNFQKSLEYIHFMFNNTSFLCIFTESANQEVFGTLVEIFRQSNTPLSIHNFVNSLKSANCESILILGTINSFACAEITSSIPRPEVPVFFVSLSSASVSDVEACVCNESWAEVVRISVSEDKNVSVEELSPVFPRPRHFSSTSLSSVLGNRVSTKKPNFRGTALPVGIVHYAIFFIFDYQNPDPDKMDGLEFELLKEFSRKLNFTYYFFPHQYFGSILENGTFENGLGQIAQNGEIEIAFGNILQVLLLYSVLDFGPALTKDKLVFLVWRPEKVDFQWQTILTIFKPQVWYGTCTSFVLVVIMYYAGVNLGPFKQTEGWTSSILTMFGSFTGSTSYSRVFSGNTRFTLTSWSVFCLLLTTSLSTGIVTRLTIPAYSPRVDTIQQLVDGQYYWTAQYYADFINNLEAKEIIFDFKNPWVQAFEKTYKYISEEKMTRIAGTDKKMVFMGQIYGNDYVIVDTDGLNGHQALQKYRVAREELSQSFATFGVKKHSALLEPLSVLTLEFLEAGMLYHWKLEVLRRWPKLDTSHMLIERDIPTFTEPRPMRLMTIKPVFFMLLFGLAVSTIVFLVELYW